MKIYKIKEEFKKPIQALINEKIISNTADGGSAWFEPGGAYHEKITKLGIDHWYYLWSPEIKHMVYSVGFQSKPITININRETKMVSTEYGNFCLEELEAIKDAYKTTDCIGNKGYLVQCASVVIGCKIISYSDIENIIQILKNENK